MTTAAHKQSWQDELLEGISLSRDGAKALLLGPDDRAAVKTFQGKFPFLVPRAYADLVDWRDPNDPLRKLLLPTDDELNPNGDWDTSGEAESVVASGLQHKYDQTAVVILTQACAGHCRYCFRRRLLTRDMLSQETIRDLDEPLAYIRNHPEIDNLLLSGGDPLVTATRRLENLFRAVSDIPHIVQIRISTKLPAFLPTRFLGDPSLLALFKEWSDRFQFLLQCHFDHPKEITPTSVQALKALSGAGCLLTSQIALMRGINDNEAVLADLYKRLHAMGVIPQYLFHPRPAKHATHFQIPIDEALTIVEGARRRLSGPEKRFRYVAVTEAGKAELVGITTLNGKEHLAVKWVHRRRGAAMENPFQLLPFLKSDLWPRVDPTH